MNGTQLIQFQCQREGTLFYYQNSASAAYLITRCPLCGCRRVKATGRTYPAVDEMSRRRVAHGDKIATSP
jgi:hypothetical protein